jgi:hypothetical protein
VPNITQLGVKVDYRLDSGGGSFVVALPECERPEPKTGVRTLGSAERCLIDECLLHHFNAFAEKPRDPQKRPHRYRHAGDATALLHLQRPAQYSADIWQVRMVLLDYGKRVTPKHRLGRDDDALVVVGVRPPEPLRLPESIQLLQREVTDDLQHGEAGLPLQEILGTKQTLVHQRRDTVQNRRAASSAHTVSAASNGKPAANTPSRANNRRSESSRRS